MPRKNDYEQLLQEYERTHAQEIIRLIKKFRPLREAEEMQSPPEVLAHILQRVEEKIEARRRFFWFPPMEDQASIRSSTTPATSVEGKILPAPENRGIILRCLYENWPNEVSMIGNDLVTQIVDEVLAGNRPEFRVPQGGFNFDLTPYM